ncbi:MAG: hypothetical protein EA411_03525 [Saprospirales bacterium]|nr:MAG: hypothetical protein EA411_03525 [Saprospirales bacterium]
MSKNTSKEKQLPINGRRVPRWLKITGLALLLLVLVVVSLRMPFVQQPLASWVANSMAKDLGLEVTVGKVNFNFINRLEIEDFLVHYHDGDTLLYAEKMYGTTKRPLTSLFRRTLEINDIRLDGTQLNIVTGPDRPDNIFQYAAKRTRDKIPLQRETEQSRIAFSIDGISAYNTKVSVEDQFQGTRQRISSEKLFIALNEVNPAEQRFSLSSVIADGIDFELLTPEPDFEKDIPEELVLRWEKPFQISQDIDLSVDYFELRNGNFRVRNKSIPVLPASDKPRFNSQKMDVTGIELQLTDLSLDSTGIHTVPNLLVFNIEDQIKVMDFNAESLALTDQKMELRGLRLLTEKSFIDEDILLEYASFESFGDFADEVQLNTNFNRTEIQLSEVLYFIPDLANNEFFKKNSHKLFSLTGKFSGNINQLRGDDIHIEIGESFVLDGNFSSRDLTHSGSELLRLQISELKTSMEGLRDMVPGFDAPDNFYKLGNLEFTGRFDGYFRDFVAEGLLKTDLGLLRTDMRLDVLNGVENALYSGVIEIKDFDLATWTGNADFGPMTLNAEVDEGMGLTKDYIYADLRAQIENFSFRGYDYANLVMDGYITNTFFDGFFSTEDPNLDFELIGAVFYGGDRFRINADIDLHKMNTKELYLTEREFELSGAFSADITQLNLKYPEGSLFVNDFAITVPDSMHTEINELSAVATVTADSLKNFNVESDILNLELDGIYFLEDFNALFRNYALKNFSYAPLLFGSDTIERVTNANFTYEFEIVDSRALTWLFAPELDTLRDSRIWGEVNSGEELYRLEFSLPEVRLGDSGAETFYGLVDFNGPIGNAVITSEKLDLGNIREINPTTFFLDFGPDTIGFALNTSEYGTVVDRMQIEGRSFMLNDYWAFRFSDSQLTLFGDDWSVQDRNQLIVGQEFFQTQNLAFSSEEKRLEIKSINDRGVNLSVSGVNIDLVNDLIDDSRYLLSGDLNAELEVANIFDVDALAADLLVSDLIFQGIEYGDLNLTAGLQTGPHPLKLDFETSHPDRRLSGGGAVFLNQDEVPEDSYLVDLNLGIESFPMMIFQNIIEDGVSGTTGTFDGELSITGNNLSHLNTDGHAYIFNSSTRVEILGVTFNINNQRVNITGDMIDMTGVELTDRMGNNARINGGLMHRNFGDMVLNTEITSDRILGLDTRREDSDLYYGTILGQLDASFRGSFQRPEIRVTAVNGPGTKFNILVGEHIESGELDFISFEEDLVAEERSFFRDVTGVNFQLDMTVNEEAEVQIIFNEQTGDILQGRGNGNFQVSLTRNGDFNIFGDYDIREGKYLFANTFALLQINKPFDVLSGGNIQWTGDPFDAIIDIEATYSGLNAAPYAFIEDYLQGGSVSAEVLGEARQSTPVDLNMLLQGYLNNPEINFTINFPNLTGQLRTLTDRKILDLEDNPDEMNRQVFALVVIGGFLPSSFNIETSVAAITNTVNEWLSTQLSLYLSDLLSNAFEDVGFISGIEMDVGYVLPTGEFVEAGRIDTRQSEVRVGLRPSLFDDRIQLDVGGNYVRESFFSNEPFLAPYGTVEYFITPDRRWRLRMTTNYDYVAEGRRNRHSLGISFRREFDTIEEFMQGIRLFGKRDHEERATRTPDAGREEEGPLLEE